MRPLKLTLEGFVGVRDGMNRDRLVLDLTSLPCGLIALTGPNGVGKTTIMDNLHPYRIMPSRSTRLSVDGFSYWDHLCAPQAQKEFEWEHADAIYRSTFVFRKPGKTGKAEYFLASQDTDGLWHPCIAPDGTESDGKAETYDRCVEAVCGSLESFFTSVFSSQGRRPLASYGTAEIKGLLAELLHIDYLRALSTKAADVAKLLSKSLVAIQAQLQAFTAVRAREAEALASLHQASNDLVQSKALREQTLSAIEESTQQKVSITARQNENEAINVRVKELAVRRREIVASQAVVINDFTIGEKRITQRRSAFVERANRNQQVLGLREAIQGAQALKHEAVLAIAEEEGRSIKLRGEIVELESKRLRHTAITSQLKSLESEGASKVTLVETLKNQASVIDTVPCVGHEMHATCPLLAQAHVASQQATEHTVSLAALRAGYKAQRAEATLLAPGVELLTGKTAELATSTQKLTVARRQLEQSTELSAKQPLLMAAELVVVELARERETIDGEANELKARCDAESKKLTKQLASIDTEMQRLIAVDFSEEIRKIDTLLVQSRNHLTAIEARIEGLIRAQVGFESARDALGKRLLGVNATQRRAQLLSDEIVHWKLLAKGLGNDGVIALTIDDAGPMLTQQVNDLLLACYGHRFTVNIRTQRELASGEMREGFEILVHDADKDSTKAVAMLSGGQKVWVNECLTRGIALYLASNAGQPYRTVFSDESDGPLDPERKVQFIRMKREVLRLGGYEREFFISHTPDLIAEADAVIDVQALAA